jgi:hypothetical protein
MKQIELRAAGTTRGRHDQNMRKNEDPGILQAALVGYQHQLDEINAKIAELRRRLGGGRSAPAASSAGSSSNQKKHRISAEGRARIAAAQRRRWAAAKKNQS